jgi:hypothetical protein
VTLSQGKSIFILRFINICIQIKPYYFKYYDLSKLLKVPKINFQFSLIKGQVTGSVPGRRDDSLGITEAIP